jgi:hypothetical protein
MQNVALTLFILSESRCPSHAANKFLQDPMFFKSKVW